MAGGRRTSLASLAGEKVDEVPGKSDPLLLQLPLDKMVPTRFNPRRNFGSEQDLKAFGAVLANKQLQPAVVVSRSGYLRLWPEEADQVGDAPYVIANGERRWLASKAVGRPKLSVVHDEEVATSRATFLDAVLSENNDREDLDPIERALGIKTMVEQLGGAGKVAEYYGKSDGWVSQQRSLLKLSPSLQELVSAGEMPVRFARKIASKDETVQLEEWEKERERRRRIEEEEQQDQAPTVRGRAAAKAKTQTPPPSQERFTAVKTETASSTQAGPPKPNEDEEVRGAGSGPGVSETRVKTTQSAPGSDVSTVPPQQRNEQVPPANQDESEPRPDTTAVPTLDAVAWQDPGAVRELIMEWMDPEPRAELLKRLLTDIDPERRAELLKTLIEDGQPA